MERFAADQIGVLLAHPDPRRREHAVSRSPVDPSRPPVDPSRRAPKITQSRGTVTRNRVLI